jgi:hypothetical protein
VSAAIDKIYQQTTFLKTVAMFAEARKKISSQTKKISLSKKDIYESWGASADAWG